MNDADYNKNNGVFKDDSLPSLLLQSLLCWHYISLLTEPDSVRLMPVPAKFLFTMIKAWHSTEHIKYEPKAKTYRHMPSHACVGILPGLAHS